MVVIYDGADTRYEVQHIADKNEKEYRHEERKELARHVAALEGFRDVVVHESDHRLHECLKLARYHLEPAAHQKRHRNQDCDDDPARNQRIGDGNAKKFSELLRRDGNMNTFIHWR